MHSCRNALRRGSQSVLHHPVLFAAQGVRYRKLEVILTTVSFSSFRVFEFLLLVF